MLIRRRTTLAPDSEKRQILPDAEFHPSSELVVVTAWASNELLVYAPGEGGLELKQRIAGADAGFHDPHSVVFTEAGTKMLVNSYSDNAIFVFEISEADLAVDPVPIQKLDTPEALSTRFPHSISVTEDGRYLASAYCDAEKGGNKVVVYRLESNHSGYQLSAASILEAEDIDFKNPKGVAFTPCGRSLLVTISDCHELMVYVFDPETGTLDRTPKQVLGKARSQLFVPEEISFSPCARYCLVSNSSNNRISFYSYDKDAAEIRGTSPEYELGVSEPLFLYPHGIGFAPDGKHLVVTDYGYYPNPEYAHPENHPAKISLFEIEQGTELSAP